MKLSKSWYRVTLFSKFLALVLFVGLPFGGFYLGMRFQAALTPIVIQVPRITTKEAINIVKQQKEVKKWLGLFSGPGQTSPSTGGKPAFAYDHTEEDNYVIRVYEIISDRSTTMGFYKVNMDSGLVTK